MRILIVVASKHGATTEIAEAIAAQLGNRGHEVDLTDPEHASPSGYGAVVVGSAVYAGSWMMPARRFIDDHAAVLTELPVWLFSSGPLDRSDVEALPEKKINELQDATEALGHHVFAGKLDRSELSFSERLMVKAVNAPDGDFRDWDDIRSWADQIVEQLSN